MLKLLKNIVSAFSARKEINRKSDTLIDLLSPQKFSELETLIGFKIRTHQIFLQALMHRSYLEQTKKQGRTYERLEFLGDSVLGLIVAEFLFEEFSEKDEGFLTKVRSKLVNREALADAAEKINLSNYLFINKNLKQNSSAGNKTILADSFEALIGAIYLDSGIYAAKQFVNKYLIEPNSREGMYLVDENYKSQLLELSQARKMENPIYSVIKEEGPQHDRFFTVQVKIGENVYGMGEGRNKKTAEQNAARYALKIFSQGQFN